MGEVISASAAAAKRIEDFRTTLGRCEARGVAAKDASDRFLAPVLLLADAAEEQRKSAREALADAEAKVDAVDARADGDIGAVRDDLWNALGRPANSPVMSAVFAGGIGSYTGQSDDMQPVMMRVLGGRLAAIDDAALQDRKSGWVQRIAAAREAMEQVLPSLRDAKAAAIIAEAAYYDAARAARRALVKMKSYLKIEGWTEAQVHELIPDREKHGGGTSK